MIAKSYTSAKNIVVNKPMHPSFFQKPIEVAEDFGKGDDAYWDAHRHDTLTITERNIFRMIDTVKKIPAVKTYVEIVNILVNGNKRIGMIDYGPYISTYGWNNVEGHRIRIGLLTNPEFSRKVVFSGYLAYGTLDQRFKYGVAADWIMSRKRWTNFRIGQTYDMEQLALMDNSVVDNSLFAAFTRIGDVNRTRPYYSRNSYLRFEKEVRKGLNLDLKASHWTFDPVQSTFNFAYLTNPEAVSRGAAPEMKNSFRTTEFSGEVRYGRDEIFVENENHRVSLGATRWPILSFRYTLGMKGILGSDLNYQKFQFSAIQYLRYGLFGNGRITMMAGLTPSTVPYPVLRAHLGNQTWFMTMSAFNMMQFFEFVSDRYATVNYQHNFEGLGLNSLPLIRKLKLRFVAQGNLLVGQVNKRNIDLIPDLNTDGKKVAGFTALDPRKPYAEVGYGVENIFQLVRVDFIHRLTYLNNPGARNFGVKVSVQFKL
jgi:hypothetical protein